MNRFDDDGYTSYSPVRDIEAEQQVIGVLLANNYAISRVVGELRKEHFYEKIHQFIYGNLVDGYTAGITVSPVTLKHKFGSELESSYLAKLLSFNSSIIDLEGCAALIVKLASQRQLQNACHFVLNAPRNSEIGDLATVLAEAIDSSNKLNLSHSIKDAKSVSYEIEELLKKESVFYSTGFDRLDSAMRGGLHAGKMYAIAADSGHGKTLMACSISGNLKKRSIHHLFICAEMGEIETHTRSMANDMDVPGDYFYDRSKQDSSFLSKFGAAVRTETDALTYYSDPFLTFDTLKQVVATSVSKNKITGFILDYWQLVGGKPSNISQADFLGEVAQWIAAACTQYNIWALCTAQLNREGEVLGSGGLKRACDQLYYLMRGNETMPEAYLKMNKTRYTKYMHVGSLENPSFRIKETGVGFEQLGNAYYSMN